MTRTCSLLTGVSLLLVLLPGVYPQFMLYDQWSSVDFDYDPKQRNDDLKSGRLRPSDVVVYDAELYMTAAGQETLFVTTPNLFGAAPFTLSTVSDSKKASDGSSLLVPFPDPSWYDGKCEDSITSVYKIKIDQLERLWVVDSGMVDHLLSNSSLICPPQILVFDLKNNNTLIKKYKIPSSQHYSDSLLVNIELDIKNGDGSDTTAYIADLTGFRMVVYDMKSDSSYAIDNPYFNPFPIYCFFRNINGVNFTLLNGLFSVALGAGANPDRTVYFHSLSSDREGFVNLSVVNDPKLAHDAFNYDISENNGFHSTVELMTPNGFLIFSNIENNSIMVWDSMKPYKPENFVTMAKDDEKLQFLTGMQLMPGNKLLVTSSRYQNVLTGRIAKGQVNYRVLINLDISQYVSRA